MFVTLSKAPALAALGVALATLLWSMPAHAYLDPATGSILLQGLLAGFAGLVVVVKLYWRRVRAFFRGERGGAGTLDAAESAPSPESK
jgi:hypothetical protein